jgi:hypothetical protein
MMEFKMFLLEDQGPARHLKGVTLRFLLTADRSIGTYKDCAMMVEYIESFVEFYCNRFQQLMGCS